MQLLLPADK